MKKILALFLMVCAVSAQNLRVENIELPEYAKVGAIPTNAADIHGITNSAASIQGWIGATGATDRSYALTQISQTNAQTILTLRGATTNTTLGYAWPDLTYARLSNAVAQAGITGGGGISGPYVSSITIGGGAAQTGTVALGTASLLDSNYVSRIGYNGNTNFVTVIGAGSTNANGQYAWNATYDFLGDASNHGAYTNSVGWCIGMNPLGYLYICRIVYDTNEQYSRENSGWAVWGPWDNDTAIDPAPSVYFGTPTITAPSGALLLDPAANTAALAGKLDTNGTARAANYAATAGAATNLVTIINTNELVTIYFYPTSSTNLVRFEQAGTNYIIGRQ